MLLLVSCTVVGLGTTIFLGSRLILNTYDILAAEGFIIVIKVDSISPQALLQGGDPFPHCDDEARLHRRV